MNEGGHVDAQFSEVDRIMQAAGLTVTDLAHLTPFSRSTIYNWRSGKKRPNPFYRSTLTGWMALITKAIDRNRLPLPVHLTGKERAQAIKRVLAEVKRLS